MDPDTTLEETRKMAEEVMNHPEIRSQTTDFHELAYDLACRFLDLDVWLKKGGFKPSDWK